MHGICEPVPIAILNACCITTHYRTIHCTMAADAITQKAEPLPKLRDQQFIMYVGRPQPHKNLRRLIKVFQLIRAKRPALKLLLVGKKEYHAKKLERWVRANSVGNVVFTSFTTDGQLSWLYEHTAVYVFPSLSEGFGLPGLEATTHGAPVVSSNATCLLEV